MPYYYYYPLMWERGIYSMICIFITTSDGTNFTMSSNDIRYTNQHFELKCHLPRSILVEWIRKSRDECQIDIARTANCARPSVYISIDFVFVRITPNGSLWMLNECWWLRWPQLLWNLANISWIAQNRRIFNFRFTVERQIYSIRK